MKKNGSVTFRLAEDQRAKLGALCGKTDLDQSEIVRMALDAMFEANGIDEAFVKRWEARRADRIVIMPGASGTHRSPKGRVRTASIPDFDAQPLAA